jgi:hypothetical protein
MREFMVEQWVRRCAACFFLAFASAPLTGAVAESEKSRLARHAAFDLEAGRVLFEAAFPTPEGGVSTSIVFFNMGMAAPVLSKRFYRELGIDRGHPLRFSVANTEFEIAANVVKDGFDAIGGLTFEQMFAPREVEAMLPASALRDHVLILDYALRTLGIERPGVKKPEGVAIPIALNPETGLAVVDVEVEGEAYPFVIDAGSGYSWMRGDLLSRWLAAHPQWRRAEGAIGRANYNMIDFSFEKKGTVARLPEIAIGKIRLTNVGVLGTGPILGAFADGLIGNFFWDNWQKSAPKPVVGWLGTNVLQNFKLTIDYPNRMSYWKAQGTPDPHDLDQPGVTLVRRDGRYFIGGLVRALNGAQASTEPISGVQIGDELLAVDDLDAPRAGKGDLLATLHGKPGASKILTLAHEGAITKVEAPVLDLR